MNTDERSTGDPEPPVVAGFTNTLMFVVCEGKPVDEPVMVTETGAAEPVSEAVLVAVNVTILVVAPAGANEAVTPLGKPDAARLTLPLKPLMP